LEYQNGFRKGRSCIDPLFRMKLLIENRRDFNLESPLPFPDYVKAFDSVKRNKLFGILQGKNIHILVLKCTIENYCGNKIRVLINSYQINIQVVMESDNTALYHPHYSTFT